MQNALSLRQCQIKHASLSLFRVRLSCHSCLECQAKGHIENLSSSSLWLNSSLLIFNLLHRITDTLDATFELEQKLLDKNAMPVLRDVQWERRMNRDMLVDIQPRMALRIISEPFFAAYPELLPEQGSTAAKKLQELSKEKKRMKFFRSEDNLLALGIDQFGKNFDLISKHLLPVATPLQLKTRAKNLCSKRESQDNPVRFLKSKKQLPTLISTVCINHPRGTCLHRI